MSDNRQTKVVPLAMPAVRMRRRAEEHMRHGRMLEAAELYRLAAQEDELPTGWLYLARLLRLCGSHEQAICLLCRVIARPDTPPDAWLELAKNHDALGQQTGATDSLYHYLEEEPYSEEADQARDMLGRLEDEAFVREPYRVRPLLMRAMAAWWQGKQALAMRRFSRALRLCDHPDRVCVTLSMLHMTRNDLHAAMQYACRALRYNKRNFRARTLQALILNARGCKRGGCALLAGCISQIDSIEDEKLFINAADMMRAWHEKRAALISRLRQKPYRIFLMMQLANEYVRIGDTAAAQQLWHTVLRMYPGEVLAREQLRISENEVQLLTVTDGSMPESARRRWLSELVRITLNKQKLNIAEILLPGSESRQAIDWCLTDDGNRMQGIVIDILAGSDEAASEQYLREALMNPDVDDQARHGILLAQGKRTALTPRPVLTGQRVAMAQAARGEEHPRAAYRRFMFAVLTEACRHGSTAQMLQLAADAWRKMLPDMRARAAGADMYSYIKAIEMICLHNAGEAQAQAKTLRDMNVSRRRVGRVILALAMRGVLVEGEMDDEVH